jgi:hypothetical protein
MANPTAPKSRKSPLDMSIGGYVLTPQAKAVIKTLAAGAAQLDSRRRALLGQAGPSPLGLSLVAAGVAPRTVLVGREGAPGPRSGTAAGTRRQAPRRGEPSPLGAAVGEFIDERKKAVSANLAHAKARVEAGVENGQRFLEERPEAFRRNLELAGLDDYFDMVSKVDMTDQGMLTPEQVRLREQARLERPTRKVYGYEPGAMGQMMPRYYPLIRDFKQFEPEPRARYEDRVSDARTAELMDGEVYSRGVSDDLVRSVEGPAMGRWVPKRLAEAVGGTYFDPMTEGYIQAEGSPEAQAAYRRIDDAERTRRRDRMAKVERDYAAVAPGWQTTAAVGRGAVDGYVADGTWPALGASWDTLVDGGDWFDNLAAQNHLIELDKRYHPVARDAGGLIGAVVPSPGIINKAKGLTAAERLGARWVQNSAMNTVGGLTSTYGSGADPIDVFGKAALDTGVGEAAPWLVRRGGDGIGALAERVAGRSPFHAAWASPVAQYAKPAATLTEDVASYFAQKALDDLLFPEPNAPP